MTSTNLSKPQKLLLVANVLTTLGRTPFDVFALAVASWERYPETFGLHGYEKQHLNANIVISAVVGTRGMAGKGWLRKVKENTYEMTTLGRECVKKIEQGKIKTKTQVYRTPEEIFLDRLTACPAYKQELRGKRHLIEFHEAKDFFGKERIENVQRKLAEIGESESPRSGEARSLMHLADWLADRFQIQFSLIGANGKGKS